MARRSHPPNARIDEARLWGSLAEMALVGPGVAGGNDRQALTAADAEGRELFAGWCRAAGLDLGVDRMGTMFATRPGTDPDALAVAAGSHLDTQPTGGRYDGVLGVLAGLEVVRTLNDLGLRTRRPITVVNWTNEEGTRFAPAMLASGVFAGVHDEAWANERPDEAGVTFGQALDQSGWRGPEAVGARRFHSYFELHIEQGPILEAEGVDIGIVTHGQGLRWMRVALTGRESHSGSTPMAMRRSASLGMARVTLLAHEVAAAIDPEALVSVGTCAFLPNSVNTVPGRAVFTLDLRHRDAAALGRMETAVREGAARISADLGLDLEVEAIGAFGPVTFDDRCVAMLRASAERMGLSHRDIVAGAGHDACWVSRVAPTAMVMCPCEGGLSHNEAEAITPEWARAGCDVLLGAILEAAEVVGEGTEP